MKRIGKIFFSTITALFVIYGMSATGYAANESSTTKMVTKGWNKTTVSSSGTSYGNDIADVTVSAQYDSTSQMGTVRVRGFSHVAPVKEYFEPRNPGYLVVGGVRKVELTTGDDTVNHDSYFNVYNTDPGPSSTSGGASQWWTIAYDIISMAGVPDNVISAIVNTLNENGPGVTVNQSSAYWRNVTQSSGNFSTDHFPDSRVDLGVENPTKNPDYYTENSVKGMQAKFWFNLGRSSTYYPMRSSAYITYHVATADEYNYYQWAPVAQVTQKWQINAQ
ncbi:hypothetical protein [Paenibacillus cineris]|uniref:Uncharacterized protein n=1 Tax=Paenibacillus cineris TaxID=237530 RepID=A0ABQ4L868_9BACL|nr:hypothetical protein [Paenibacillus cineris]GIO52766.1 hypothetical protein J21TS7_10840 [Paenibacillus cineris]